MADSGDSPVFKITIQRESPVKGGEAKFSLVPENFTLPGQTTPTPVPLPSKSVCPSAGTSPVFSSGSYMKCAVPNCNNYFDGQRCEFMGISYFPFPEDPELRQEWITAIDLPPDKDTDQLKVCSDHFMNKDFVSDVIEIEDGPEETTNPKKLENVELKPGVKPSVKLGETQKTQMMADYAKETWEKNVKTYGENSNKGKGRLGKFAGLENPLMDTANELRSSVDNPVTCQKELDSSASVNESSTVDSVVPIITSVGTIRHVTLDNISNREVSIGNKSQKELDRERANTHGTLVDVVEVEDDEDDMLEEVVTQKEDQEKQQQKPSETEQEIEMDQGLINVPASVKLPPRKTITGDSSTSALSQPSEPVPSSSKDDTTLNTTSDDVMPSTSSCWPPDPTTVGPVRRPVGRPRGRRRTRAEMQKQEEEDEWEPTFWSKKTLAKEGYEFDPKRRSKPFVTIRAPKNMDTSDEEAGLEEFNEGFRIDEPVATRSHTSSPEKRRRPGPASKTCRPQYVPPTSDHSDADNAKNGAIEKDLEEVLADKSLLVEWAFFKSLIPDLGRMSREKRDELKTFMLDTLNSRIYEGKAIVPNCRDPVKI